VQDSEWLICAASVDHRIGKPNRYLVRHDGGDLFLETGILDQLVTGGRDALQRPWPQLQATETRLR
jgi:hypothetical protein